MTVANNTLNAAIARGNVRYQLRHVYLRADNFFNDEAKNRVIFQFDWDDSAIILCTKNWIMQSVKHFSRLKIVTTPKKYNHTSLTILERRRVTVKRVINDLYAQEFRDVKYRELHNLNHPRNKDLIDRLAEARYNVKHFADNLLFADMITGLNLVSLKCRYKEFIAIGEEMRNKVEEMSYEN